MVQTCMFAASRMMLQKKIKDLVQIIPITLRLIVPA
jgi:hypothetical protein